MVDLEPVFSCFVDAQGKRSRIVAFYSRIYSFSNWTFSAPKRLDRLGRNAKSCVFPPPPWWASQKSAKWRSGHILPGQVWRQRWTAYSNLLHNYFANICLDLWISLGLSRTGFWFICSTARCRKMIFLDVKVFPFQPPRFTALRPPQLPNSPTPQLPPNSCRDGPRTC